MPRPLRLFGAIALTFLLGLAAFAPSASAQTPCVPSAWRACLGLRASDLGSTDTPLQRLTPRSVGEPWSVAANDSLPSGMPLNTQILWGRRGVLRTLGVGPSTRRGERMMRREMLGWHQRLGLLTFAAMTTQVVLGELVAANPAKHYESLQPVHRTLGYTTFGLYTVTAGFSIAAPPGRRYSSGGFSSIRLHRWLAVVHFAGMMATPFLGRRIADAQGFDQLQDRRRQHQLVGRVTYGAFALAIASTLLAY